ncbi:MAG: hypothetical protein ACRDT6_26980 [Micromonosporaceae bacterium]
MLLFLSHYGAQVEDLAVGEAGGMIHAPVRFFELRLDNTILAGNEPASYVDTPASTIIYKRRE